MKRDVNFEGGCFFYCIFIILFFLKVIGVLAITWFYVFLPLMMVMGAFLFLVGMAMIANDRGRRG